MHSEKGIAHLIIIVMATLVIGAGVGGFLLLKNKEGSTEKQPIFSESNKAPFDEKRQLPLYPVPKPINYPSGTVVLLFSTGWNKPDAPGGGIVYYDETTKNIRPVNRSPVIPISYYARERSGEVFYIADLKTIYRGDLNFRPVEKIAEGVRATDLHIPTDGPYIAFTNIETETATDMTTTVYAAKVDGTEHFKIPIPQGVKRFMFNRWLPGNKKLLLQSDEPGAMILWEADLPSKTIKKFDRYTDYLYADMPIPVFSPDGQRLAYIKDIGNHAKEIWVSNASGSEPKRVFQGGDNLIWAMWAPDSKKFHVVAAALAPGIEGDDVLLFFDREGNLIRELIPDPVGEALSPILWSDDSRYLFLGTEMSDATVRPGKIILYDFHNDKIGKEFPTEGMKIPLEHQLIWKIVYSPSGKFYYEVIPKNFADALKIDDSFPQLWVIDTTTMEKKKISDNASNAFILVIP